MWQRFTKIPQGAAFGVARVLKEFNESCPVLTALLEEIATASKPVTVIDLCSGFGFPILGKATGPSLFWIRYHPGRRR